MKFYLAAGYDQRVDAQVVAKAIEDATGFKCNAQWLWQDQDLDSLDAETLNAKLNENAVMDWEDVQQASALVLLSGASTSGAKWIELGMAVAYNKKVYYLDKWLTLLSELHHEPQNLPLPIFLRLSVIEWADNFEHLVNLMLDQLKPVR